jgi:hypothetical protein
MSEEISAQQLYDARKRAKKIMSDLWPRGFDDWTGPSLIDCRELLEQAAGDEELFSELVKIKYSPRAGTS